MIVLDVLGNQHHVGGVKPTVLPNGNLQLRYLTPAADGGTLAAEFSASGWVAIFDEALDRLTGPGVVG